MIETTAVTAALMADGGSNSGSSGINDSDNDSGGVAEINVVVKKKNGGW